MILLNSHHFRNPLVIDLLKVRSGLKNQYDLPLWFMGHHLDATFDYNASTTSLMMMGEDNGYQHLWKEGSTTLEAGSEQFTWFGDGRFYTVTMEADQDDEVIFARSGAQDPNFNLRHDPVLIHRRSADNTLYASVIESHGRYNPVSEIPLSPFSGIKSIETLYDDEAYSVIRVAHNSGDLWTIAISYKDNSADSAHSLMVDNIPMEWKGTVHINHKMK